MVYSNPKKIMIILNSHIKEQRSNSERKLREQCCGILRMLTLGYGDHFPNYALKYNLSQIQRELSQ